MQRKVELIVGEVGETLVLRSPEVGRFTCALDRGNLVSPGEHAGRLRTLGETVELVVPAGVTGRVTNDKPERVHQPVGYGDVLYELAPIDALEGVDSGALAGSAQGDELTAFRAPYAGRFWHRSAPGEPSFVGAGDVVEAGAVLGLLEVMKTFTHVTYSPGDHLPARARVLRVLVGDGDEVDEAAPLVEVEPA